MKLHLLKHTQSCSSGHFSLPTYTARWGNKLKSYQHPHLFCICFPNLHKNQSQQQRIWQSRKLLSGNQKALAKMQNKWQKFTFAQNSLRISHSKKTWGWGERIAKLYFQMECVLSHHKYLATRRVSNSVNNGHEYLTFQEYFQLQVKNSLTRVAFFFFNWGIFFFPQ